MNPIRKPIDITVHAARKGMWHEPVRSLGAAIAVLTVMLDAFTRADVTNWHAAVPVILAEIFRRFVYSPATNHEENQAAFMAGFQFRDDEAK